MGKRVLIVGASESGKSFHAMKMAKNAIAYGWHNIVYSPIMGDAWENCERHADPDEFMGRVVSLMRHVDKTGESLPVALWIDEADELLSVSQKANHWLLKKGRHYFPYIHVLTQRPKMVAPTVRGQCNELVAFTLKDDDAAELGRDFVADLRELPSFRQGEYYHVKWAGRERSVEKIDGFLDQKQ